MNNQRVGKMSISVQPAGVARKFYPADPAQLAAGVDASLTKAVPSSTVPKAVIAPHAGHVYSGDVAGTAYNLLARRKGEIKRVVLLGPNHRMLGCRNSRELENCGRSKMVALNAFTL